MNPRIGAMVKSGKIHAKCTIHTIHIYIVDSNFECIDSLIASRFRYSISPNAAQTLSDVCSTSPFFFTKSIFDYVLSLIDSMQAIDFLFHSVTLDRPDWHCELDPSIWGWISREYLYLICNGHCPPKTQSLHSTCFGFRITLLLINENCGKRLQ